MSRTWFLVAMFVICVSSLGCSGVTAERRGWEDGYAAYHAHTYQKGFQNGYRAAGLIDRGMDVPEEDREPNQ